MLLTQRRNATMASRPGFV